MPRLDACITSTKEVRSFTVQYLDLRKRQESFDSFFTLCGEGQGSNRSKLLVFVTILDQLAGARVARMHQPLTRPGRRVHAKQ
jgi:hypothetical protein